MNKKLIMAKARGFTISIEKMGEEEKRLATPSASFSDDYNRLRQASATLHPELESLLPPEVSFKISAHDGERYARSRFSEIDAYCEQIYQLMSECDD